MTVQDFLCLLLWMIQDFKVVLVSFNQSVSALRAFRRGTVLRLLRRGSYWSAQLSNCAGSSLLYIKCCHVAGYPDHLNLVGLLVTCLITLPIFHLRTHRGTLDFPDQVNAYLSKELKLGRIAGPFDTVPLAQVFVVSPLNIVEKRDSEEWRVRVDMSWSCGHSVNDDIPSDSYLGEPRVLR